MPSVPEAPPTLCSLFALESAGSIAFPASPHLTRQAQRSFPTHPQNPAVAAAMGKCSITSPAETALPEGSFGEQGRLSALLSPGETEHYGEVFMLSTFIHLLHFCRETHTSRLGREAKVLE